MNKELDDLVNMAIAPRQVALDKVDVLTAEEMRAVLKLMTIDFPLNANETIKKVLAVSGREVPHD